MFIVAGRRRFCPLRLVINKAPKYVVGGLATPFRRKIYSWLSDEIWFDIDRYLRFQLVTTYDMHNIRSGILSSREEICPLPLVELPIS